MRNKGSTKQQYEIPYWPFCHGHKQVAFPLRTKWEGKKCWWKSSFFLNVSMKKIVFVSSVGIEAKKKRTNKNKYCLAMPCFFSSATVSTRLVFWTQLPPHHWKKSAESCVVFLMCWDNFFAGDSEACQSLFCPEWSKMCVCVCAFWLKLGLIFFEFCPSAENYFGNMCGAIGSASTMRSARQ